MSSKDYSNYNHLALAHVPDIELANKCLQQNRSSEELISILRAAHDRIMHRAVVSTNNKSTSSFTEALTDAQRADFGKDTAEFKLQCEIRELTKQLEASQAEAAALKNNLQNAEVMIGNLNAQLNSANTELDKCKSELTQAYLATNIAQAESSELRAQLQHIAENYEIDESDEQEVEHEADCGKPHTLYIPTKDELRTIALNRGFRVRPQGDGTEDLNSYVYDTMTDAIKYSAERS